MDYVRIDPLILGRPKVVAAGWWGAQVYLFLIITAGKYDLKGRIGSRYQNRDWLLREWGLPEGAEPSHYDNRTQALDAGLTALFHAGLLEEVGFDWLITGWEEFYGRRDHSTPRVKALREAAKAEKIPVGTKVASAKLPETDETLPTHPPTEPTHPPTAAEGELQEPGQTAEQQSNPRLWAEQWNSVAQGCGLAQVKLVTQQRARHVTARLREHPPVEILQALYRLPKLPGLCGANDRKWKADFDWFFSPGAIAKILEGKYDRWGKQGGEKNSPPPLLSDPSQLYGDDP